MNLDVTITVRDVQELANADAITAFFARLGWRTDARIEQSPGNLGIMAEGTTKPVKKIELIADQDGALQVYVFELTSVTIANMRAIVRAFRERAGNYLLVFTSSYDRLDFVLIEKYLPSRPCGRTIGVVSVGVRPRILSVDRRKPTTVDLRVLRRFSYTESDPYAQYDKLLSAYSIADWSEDHFNNRALFSDYYLTERLPGLREWQEDPKPTYVSLSKIYEGASVRLANKTVGTLEADLFEPVTRTLGFHLKRNQHRKPGDAEPSYRVYSNGDEHQPIATALVYPWGRYLDGKDDQRDNETKEENPGAIVVSLLEKGEASWAIVTNGRIWRLYSAKAHSRATNYYEIDVEELLSQDMSESSDPATTFRYFWLLFRSQSFVGQAQYREGREVVASFLDQLLSDSEDYAKELGDRLKERVFEDIFPHISEGFISFIRKREGVQADLSQEALDEVFQGTLALLYRILFLLYAEARDLLPVKEVRGYYEVSLKKIKEEAAEIAGKIEDEAEQKLKKGFRDDVYRLYDRLTALFKVLDCGDAMLNVPFYNGGLFLSNPEDEDETSEAANARFLNTTKLADRFLARAIDLLARDVDTKNQALAFIDYKSLGVRQLGSIYEGLLEFKLRIASEKMATVQGKRTEEIIPYREAVQEERRILTIGRGRLAEERVLSKGTVYLENDKRERRATGSYYTPDHIVEYIVENAVGPVLKEKFETLRPKLRKAQSDRKAFCDRQKAFAKSGMKSGPESKADLIGQSLVDELFDVKVLDPAMGSGHFLVEAVDFITDKALDLLNAFPWNPVSVHLEKMRKDIMKEMEDLGITIDAARLSDVNLLKRHVLKRCIYGVDLNPMAVELAKVSLWLDCFTLGAPLSFLDHHIKCGNSLIGVTVNEVDKAAEEGQYVLWGSHFTHLKLAAESMREVTYLSDLTGEQVRQSRKKFLDAADLLAGYKRILDVYSSQWFGNKPVRSKKGKRGTVQNKAIDFLKSEEAQILVESGNQAELSAFVNVVDVAASAAKEMRFFHWELEFPEVFFEKGMRKSGAGFDAVIGNPPYDEPSAYHSGTTAEEQDFFSVYPLYRPFKHGRLNLYRLFLARAFISARDNGFLSFIVPMAMLADDFSRPMREFILQKTGVVSIDAFPQKDDPHKRVFFDAKLSTCVLVDRKAEPTSRFVVRTHPGRSLEPDSPYYVTNQLELRQTFKSHLAVPTISSREWVLLKKCFARGEWPTLTEVAQVYVGEIFDNSPNKKFLNDKPMGPLVLRGAHIDRYLLREESTQGRNRYLKEDLFLKKRKRGQKMVYISEHRIGLQRGAAVDNWRRLIACIVPSNSYCFDTVLLLAPIKISLEVLLALVNSDLWEWRFRCTSSTNHVNEYELSDFAIPPILLDHSSQPAGQLRKMVGGILRGEEKLVRRSEAQVAPVDSSDRRIDQLIFELYGLDLDDVAMVTDCLNGGVSTKD